MSIYSTNAYESLTASTDSLTASLQIQTDQLNQIAESALASGIDKYQDEDFEGAVSEFERYIGMMRAYAFDSETTTYLGEASDYLASSYMKLEKTEKAIEVYETGIELEPDRIETRAKLGNLYFSLERYGDAEEAYRGAYDLDKEDPNVAFSLGQALLKMEKFADAMEIFQAVENIDPESANGVYGQGMVYRDQGDTDEAIEKFKEATEIDDEFYDAWAELGYLYADTGQTELADEVFEFLDDNDENLADTLSRYMYKAEAPQIAFVGAESTFPRYMGVRSQVSAIDSYLENANTSKQFTMIFQFNKEMSMSSVQNRTNWTISRSDKSGGGELYNFGAQVQDTETKISPLPDRVVYDPISYQATVYFSISQNSAADATIDPSHILFTFSGEDVYGNAMDEDADDYMGFSGVG